jgi:hypothetical protein
LKISDLLAGKEELYPLKLFFSCESLSQGVELFHDGVNGRADFDVVMGQSQLGVHFPLVGMGEFSASFWAIVVNIARIVAVQEGARCAFEAKQLICIQDEVLRGEITRFHLEALR